MFQRSSFVLGFLVLTLAMFPLGCSKSEGEAPAGVAENAENGQLDAAQQDAQAGQAPAGAPAANPVAPSGSRPSGGTASAPANRPSTQPSQAASSSTATGWGDQPVEATQTQPAAPVIQTYTLPAGSPVRIRTTSTMASSKIDTGATFVASLAEPLQVDGRIIAERGANVSGRVVNSDPGGRIKGRALLQVAITGVQLVNGERANLTVGAFEQEADSAVKRDAAKVAIGSGVGAAIGAIAGGGKGAAIGAGVGAGAGTGAVLATRGNDAVIPAETVITFNTQAPVSVDLPR